MCVSSIYILADATFVHILMWGVYQRFQFFFKNHQTMTEGQTDDSDSGHSQELFFNQLRLSWFPKTHDWTKQCNMCTYCVLKVKVWQCLWTEAELWTHLAAQSGELAEGDDQIVKHIVEAIVSCNHRTFPAKHRRLHTLTADKHKLFILHSLLQLNNWTPDKATPVLKRAFFGQSFSYSNHTICPSTVNNSNLCVGGACFSYRLTRGCGHLKAVSSLYYVHLPLTTSECCIPEASDGLLDDDIIEALVKDIGERSDSGTPRHAEQVIVVAAGRQVEKDAFGWGAAVQ